MSDMLHLWCYRGSPNTVSVVTENGSVWYQTDYRGPDVGPPNPSSYPTLSEPYSAYSPNGSVEVRLYLLSSQPALHTAPLVIQS